MLKLYMQRAKGSYPGRPRFVAKYEHFVMFLSGIRAVHFLGFQVSELNVHDGSLYCIFAAFQFFIS